MGENGSPSTTNEVRAKGSSSKEDTSPEEVRKSTGKSTSQQAGNNQQQVMRQRTMPMKAAPALL